MTIELSKNAYNCKHLLEIHTSHYGRMSNARLQSKNNLKLLNVGSNNNIGTLAVDNYNFFHVR